MLRGCNEAASNMLLSRGVCRCQGPLSLEFPYRDPNLTALLHALDKAVLG